MWIKKIVIDGFGIFYNKEIDFKNGLNIIFGSNEAGKTTLMMFLRGIFFGRKSVLKYPHFNEGNYGGRAFLVSSHGEEYIIERDFLGRKSTFQKANGEFISETSFFEMLGNPTEILFKNVFCFGLSELEDFKTLGDEEVSGRIYSAGLGTMKSLVSINAEIDKTLDKIYKKGGRKGDREVKKLATVLQNLENEIHLLQEDSVKYNELKYELQKIEKNIAEDEALQFKINKEIIFYESLLKGWQHWLKIKECEEQLSLLEKIDFFPSFGMTTFENLKKQLVEVKREIDFKKEDFEAIEKKLKNLVINYFAIDNSDKIEELKDNLAVFINNFKRLQKVKDEYKVNHFKLEDLLESLGPSWTEKKVKEVDISLQSMIEIENYRQNFEDLQWKEKTLQKSLRDLQRIREELLQEIKRGLLEKQKLQDALLFRENLEEIRNTVFQIEELNRSQELLLLEKEQLQKNLEETAEELSKEKQSTFKVPVFIAFIIAFIFSIPVYIFSDSKLYSLLIFLTVMMMNLLAFKLSRRYIYSGKNVSYLQEKLENFKQEISRNEKNLSEVVEKILNLKKVIPVKANLNPDDLSSLKRKIEEEFIRQSELKQREDTLLLLNDKLTLKEKEIEEIGRQNVLIEENNLSLKKKWQSFLAEKGLGRDLRPENTPHVVEIIKKAKDLIEKKELIEEEISLLENSCKKYLDSINEFYNADFTEFTDVGEVTAKVKELSDSLNEAREKLTEREKLLTQKNEIFRFLEKEEKKLAGLQEEIEYLFSQAGADNEECFKKRAEIYLQREKLKQSIAEHTANLKTVAQGFDFDIFLKKLSSSNQFFLQNQFENLHKEAEKTRKRLDQNWEKKGSLNVQLSGMLNDERLSECLLKENIYKEKLKKTVKKWVVHTMAKEMLNCAKEKYEKERQPKVLKNASKYIDIITSGRYQKAFSPYGTNILKLQHNSGKIYELAQLSRGTAEQLYLSMRCALVEEFANQAANLPIIMDDPFVNFDDERLQKTVFVLDELAKKNQILLFTCHQSVLKKAKNEDVKIINLNTSKDILEI